jgi:AcrR family transcriptional regulator
VSSTADRAGARRANPGGGKKPVDPARRTRDPERTAAAILDAAVREFSDKGYGGARVDAIARRAGANKRMLYYYFGAKEALYLAVLERAYAGIRTAEAALHLTERHPIAAMRELALFTWSYFLRHPEFLSLLATENMQKARVLKRSSRIVDLHSPLVSQIRELLSRGAADGCFRQGTDPVTVYLSFASLSCFYLSNRYTLSVIFGRNLGEKAALAAWGDHIADIVLSWLRSDADGAPTLDATARGCNHLVD